MADKHVLVLGAYGLIGAGITRHFIEAGFDVTGSGRSKDTAAQVLPNLPFRITDLNDIHSMDQWAPLLRDITHVVNCSGALQDSSNDDLEHIHHKAIATLAQACAAQNIHLTQISAIGATLDASTQFLSSKARGDRRRTTPP